MKIKELVDTFNELLESIEKAFDSLSTFSSDASYELKTLLTAIQGEAEVGPGKGRATSQYKAILEDVLNGSHFLNTLPSIPLIAPCKSAG